MAGRFRRKFVTIISDKFKEHYQGKVAEQVLDEGLIAIEKLIETLENSKQNNARERVASLRMLKRLPLDKLQKILAGEA